MHLVKHITEAPNSSTSQKTDFHLVNCVPLNILITLRLWWLICVLDHILAITNIMANLKNAKRIFFLIEKPK